MVDLVKRRRLAVIPARGGSRRIPRKNIADFAGRPLLAWSVAAALDSGCFDRVVVSTEDEEIAAAARQAGADVPFLRDRFADDVSNVSDVTADAVRRLAALGDAFHTVAMLQATCPLRDAGHVRAAVEAFDASGAASQMSCFRFDWMNPWWAFRLRDDGTADFIHPEMIGRRSQDLPPAFGLTGAICLSTTDALLATGSLRGPRTRFEPLPWAAAVDIDEPEDLAFALAVKATRDAAGS